MGSDGDSLSLDIGSDIPELSNANRETSRMISDILDEAAENEGTQRDVINTAEVTTTATGVSDAASSFRYALRDVKGRFTAPEPASEEERRKNAEKETQKEQDLSLGTVWFERLVNAIMLKGARDDWIPADVGVGTFTVLCFRLFKARFIPPKTSRAEVARDRFFDFNPGKSQEQISFRIIRHGISKQKYRKRVFHGWRLPRLSSRPEMKKVEDWIRGAEAENILKVGSREEAYEIFRTQLKAYRYHGDKKEWCYDNYPPPTANGRSLTSAEAAEATRVESVEEVGSIFAPTQSGLLGSNSGGLGHAQDRSEREVQQSGGAGEVASGRISIHSLVNGSGTGEQIAASLQDREIAMQIHRIICTARDSKLFYLLCKVSDEECDTMIACASPALLLEHRNGSIKFDTLLLDVLLYVHAEHFGINRVCPDIQEHRERKRRIDLNVSLLKTARKCLNMIPYERMSFREFLPSEGDCDMAATRSARLDRGQRRSRGR